MRACFCQRHTPGGSCRERRPWEGSTALAGHGRDGHNSGWRKLATVKGSTNSGPLFSSNSSVYGPPHPDGKPPGSAPTRSFGPFFLLLLSKGETRRTYYIPLLTIPPSYFSSHAAAATLRRPASPCYLDGLCFLYIYVAWDIWDQCLIGLPRATRGGGGLGCNRGKGTTFRLV